MGKLFYLFTFESSYKEDSSDIKFMGLTGFEPVTARLWAERSNLTELQALVASIVLLVVIRKELIIKFLHMLSISWKDNSKKCKNFTPLAGLEPTTFWLTARHSTNWVKAAYVVGCAFFAHPVANILKAMMLFIYFAWNCFHKELYKYLLKTF